MNANGRFGGLLKNHGVSLVIGAATAGFAAHINSSVTHIHNNVSTIQTTVSAQDDAIAGSIAALKDTLKSVSAVTWRIEVSQNLHESLSDTLRGRVEVLSGEIDTLRNRIDTLHDSLRGLPGRIGTVSDSLANRAIKLQESVDNLRDSIETVSIRFVEKADSLQDFAKEARIQNDEIHSVQIMVGAADTLVAKQRLRTRQFLFFKKYMIESFPNTSAVGKVKDGGHVDTCKVMSVRIGRSFTVSGKVAALCGFHGKLRRGKDYAVRMEQSDTTRVTFTGSTYAGQRILVVLK